MGEKPTTNFRLHPDFQALLKFRASIQPQKQVHHPEMQARRKGADHLNSVKINHQVSNN